MNLSTNTGQELYKKYLRAPDVNPNLVSGNLDVIYNINSKNYGQGIFRYAPGQSIPVTVVELKDDIFGQDTIVTNHAIYHGFSWLNCFNKTIDNKLLSASTITPSSQNYVMSLAKLNLNLQYNTAYTGNFIYDSLCIPGPPQSGFIYLNDCDIVLGAEMPRAAQYRARISTIPLTIYPNPSNDMVTVGMENTGHHRNIELRCFNLLGVQRYHTRVQRWQKEATFSVSAWPVGMYVAVVYSDGRPEGRGKFVVSR